MKTNRRNFLKTSAVLTASTSTTANLFVPAVHAAENNEIKVGLVGCGGRGGGAIMQALSTKGPKKLVALGDIQPNRLKGVLNGVSTNFADAKDVQVDVPEDRQFIGFDAYKKVVEAVGAGGVVLFATPPVFRPLHVEYAVEKGVHVFMEKSFAVDAPGVRRMLATGKKADEKGIKVVGGTEYHYSASNAAAIEEIRKGIIGEPNAVFSYRTHGAIKENKRQDGESELMYQIRNYNVFTWVNGSMFQDYLIHNHDIACWAMDTYPVDAQGSGGRAIPVKAGTTFDHYAVEYTFPNGARMVAQFRHQDRCWNYRKVEVLGGKGVAYLGEHVNTPTIYKGFSAKKENLIWKQTDKQNPFQVEHDVLFDAIRNDKPHNDIERCAKVSMTAILGRMAVFSGQKLTWDDTFKSKVELCPNIDTMTWDTPPPVLPDKDGNYPLAVPGTRSSSKLIE
ncbi:MAG: Gfo/Idh/MocA family oxidoreductase [Planctomycetaceae bacterium]|nr:Gfo/Idh/MocA family oxidoreductase [Planctomycetaceae bacterium]